jgi:uncharacterized protein YcbK (DUF882 family)
MIDRRQLNCRAILACGAAAPMWTRSALADSAGVRSVSFVHTHTGEKLSAAYWTGRRFAAGEPSAARLPHDDVHVIDQALIDVLPALRTTVGPEDAFHVIASGIGSGFRSSCAITAASRSPP